MHIEDWKPSDYLEFDHQGWHVTYNWCSHCVTPVATKDGQSVALEVSCWMSPKDAEETCKFLIEHRFPKRPNSAPWSPEGVHYYLDSMPTVNNGVPEELLWQAEFEREVWHHAFYSAYHSWKEGRSIDEYDNWDSIISNAIDAVEIGWMSPEKIKAELEAFGIDCNQQYQRARLMMQIIEMGHGGGEDDGA